MFHHRTRSGRAWSCRSCRADGPSATALRLTSPALSGGPAPQGRPVSEPLHDFHGVKEEEEEDGSIRIFVKDLRTRRVFTPSSLPVECSPDRNSKASVADEACFRDLFDAGESDGVAEPVAKVESSPDAVNAMVEAPEKVGVLKREGERGEYEMLQTPGILEEGGIQSTPPDLHVISKEEPSLGGSDVASQRSGGCANEGFRLKQKNCSDQSLSKMGIVPCSRMKLVRDPKSFSYRRLLPFLMDLTRSCSNPLEVFDCQRHPVKIAKPMVEKSFQPLSSSPVQTKVDLSEKVHEHLDCIGRMEEIVGVLEQPGTETHKLMSGNSKDNIHDTAAKSSSSYTEGAKPSSQFTHELDVICKSSSNLPAATKVLSVQELMGCKQEPSDSPAQPKTASGTIVNGCTRLSAPKSQFGAACPWGVNQSTSMKGILKRYKRGCIGLCTCLDCASFRLHAERAFEFSRKQMQGAEDVAMGLINELSCLRKLVENNYAIATCVSRNDIHQHGQVKGLCKRASRAEDVARKRLREMNDDLNAHCRYIRPRVTFSESTEERVISEIETSDAE